MTEYYVRTNCYIRFWKLFYGEVPDYNCTDIYVNYVIEKTNPLGTLNVSYEYLIGYLLFLLSFSLIGIVIVEFCNTKFGIYGGYIYDKILWRYNYIKYRELSYTKFCVNEYR